jgi:hypothetical protein
MLLLLTGTAYADVGGILFVPPLENGKPSEDKQDRIPLSSFSWEGTLPDDGKGAEVPDGLERTPPKGHAGVLVVAKPIKNPTLALASYCKAQTPLKAVIVKTPIWTKVFPDREVHYRTYKLSDVTVEKCGYMPGAVAETFHFAFLKIAEVND